MKFRPQTSFNLMLTLLLSWLCLGSGKIALHEIETAIIEKDYPTAKQLAEQFINTRPGLEPTQEASYYWGLSHLRLNEFSQARELFGRLIKQTKNQKLKDQAALGIIDSYSLEGNYPQALAQAEQLLHNSPNSEFLSLIYLKLGRANLKLAHWDTAREYLNKIVQGFPDSVEWHLARQLLEEKQYFAVQLGAFLDPDRAQSLTEELKARGEYAYIVETTDAQGQKFYRVRVGQLAGLKEAQDLMTRLAQLGYPTQIYP